MADVICSKCDVDWVIYSHDKHCGYCGCKLFDFSVKWQEEPLLYADGGADIYDLTILVENTGASLITFQPIGTTRENTVQFPDANHSPFEVKAGQQHAIPIQVNPANLTKYAETITVRAQNVLPNLDSEKSLNLEVLSHPAFKLIPNAVVVRYRKGTEKKIEDLHLEVMQSQFYINAIKVNQGLVSGVGYSQKLHEKNSAPKKVHLEIDCNQLDDESNEVTLSFDILGIPQPIEKKIQLQKDVLPEPAKLFVQKSNLNLEVTQERKKESILTLQNRGELPLTIKNIVFSGPSDLVQVLNVEYPITIEGGVHHNVDVLVSAEGIAPETYPINFTLHSNCEAAPQYQDVLNVRVREQEKYQHYLAIDFGTTNSCCAYIGPTGVPELIPLDIEANPSEIMPSLIVYHSNPTNGQTHSIGYDADTYRTSEIDGPYYITSVKRWLGYQWERFFPANQKLQPCDVVAHILKHIIRQAENHLDSLKTQSKINRCVITHPTIFSSKQRKDLEIAFNNIGISDLKLIDEASAASLGAIYQRYEYYTKLQGSYRLLVYDFGGGTIDIVLSEVISDGNEITIEPLAHGGNPRYGGDDVTQAIVDFVLDAFKKRFQKENPNLPFEIPYTSLRKIWQPSGDPRIDRSTRQNTRILYNTAEDMKKELSKQDESNRDFLLSVDVGGDIRPIESYTDGDVTVIISVEQLKSLIASELYQTFNNIDATINETGGNLPETVILAGQSSKMPMVKNMMATHFRTKYQTDVDIYLSESPKECVAMGAAQFGMIHSSPSKDKIKIINPSKTHSRLGIIQVERGKQVFGEIIPKGKLIPADSSNTVDFPLNDRMVVIDVREHFGTDNELSNTSPVDNYTLTLPPNVRETFLRKARLQMGVDTEGEIELTALVDGDEYTFTVKKQEPEFVSEI